MYYYTTAFNDCQEVLQVLHDKPANGRRERPWAVQKLMNGYLALAYDVVEPRKAERLRGCATWLQFSGGDGVLKLHNANFCRVRLCPVCAWRRALKTYGQVRAIMADLGDSYRYIFLTLTVPNCDGDALGSTITQLVQGFNRLMKYKSVSKVVKGYYRGLEVTHNVDNDTYHPHIHALLAVNPSYFTSRDYLRHDKWLALWRRAAQDNSIMQVDVRTIKGATEHACAEVAKYAVKPGDVICFDDWDLTVRTVAVLDKALASRRLIGFGGCFADAHKRLHLDDAEDGDLTHVETDVTAAEDEELITYAWHTGYSQYVRKFSSMQ